MQFLTLSQAAELSGKSIQTIRRMIKQKKINVKRQKTPQGFNYLVIKTSLLNFIEESQQLYSRDASDNQNMPREHRPLELGRDNEFKVELERLNTTIQKLIEQHEKDKGNFFQLVKTFQDRNIALENQIKFLEAPKPSRWKFWK